MLGTDQCLFDVKKKQINYIAIQKIPDLNISLNRNKN